MNKVHTKHYPTDRRNSSYQTLLLSLYLTQTWRGKSHEKRISVEELKFLQDMKMLEWHWHLPKQTTASEPSAPRRPLLVPKGGREQFQLLLPTFPAATAHKTLMANISQPCVFTEWGGQAENLIFSHYFVCDFLVLSSSAWDFSAWGRGRMNSACPIACVDHSAHQNSSWVAPYPGDPAKHLALGSRIVPELWMLEKHSNNSDTDSCCYSNLKSFFF